MTEITGIHHVTLSVTDLNRSVEWYVRVLGFEELRRLTHGGLDKAMLRLGGVTVTFVSHGGLAVPGPFDERRTGLDHLSFAVADRAALEAWMARLDEHGVVHSDIVTGSTGDLFPFRDPDNIALEFYTRRA
jgi:catechol 2,3-dioxygenase-like lactoylglutathione lyase family enzyme